MATDVPDAGKRIAFVSQGLGRIEPPKAQGSIAIWTYETSRQLSRDYSVLLLELGKHPFGTKVMRHDGLTCAYVPGAINRLINGLHRRMSRVTGMIGSGERRMLRPDYASAFHNLGYIIQAAWFARRQGCEIIHIHNFSQFIPIVRVFNPKAFIVLHMNCEWLSQHDRAMIARRIKDADAIICCSEHVRHRLLESFPEVRAKSHVVFNGANVERFSPPERRAVETEARILFVGRVSPEKGVHVLVEAFTKVAARFPNVFLDVVGGLGSLPKDFLVGISRDALVQKLAGFYSTDYFAELKKRIPEALKERVVFHGNVSHDALAAYYRRATVFASPSFSDAFPLTVVEAMGAGLPVVASAVGGIREAVVDGVTGLLVEPGNSDALAEVLCRLLRDPDTCSRMGAAARSRAIELFSWSAIAEQLSRVYALAGRCDGRGERGRQTV